MSVEKNHKNIVEFSIALKISLLPFTPPTPVPGNH